MFCSFYEADGSDSVFWLDAGKHKLYIIQQLVLILKSDWPFTEQALGGFSVCVAAVYWLIDWHVNPDAFVCFGTVLLKKKDMK